LQGYTVSSPCQIGLTAKNLNLDRLTVAKLRCRCKGLANTLHAASSMCRLSFPMAHLDANLYRHVPQSLAAVREFPIA
jgi:hypothetical protein